MVDVMVRLPGGGRALRRRARLCSWGFRDAQACQVRYDTGCL